MLARVAPPLSLRPLMVLQLPCSICDEYTFVPKFACFAS